MGREEMLIGRKEEKRQKNLTDRPTVVFGQMGELSVGCLPWQMS